LLNVRKNPTGGVSIEMAEPICVIQLSKFLNHTLATHNQVDSFFENINHNDGKGAFTLTLFEMTITDCPGFHVPHCTVGSTEFRTPICTSLKKNYLV
jgi:hypothetical protein